MATDTFTWAPKVESTGTTAAKVLKAQFGDGYEQTAADGINSISESWPLTFSGTGAEIAPIRAFLIAHKGAAAFYWTPPLGEQGLYKSDEWQLIPHGGDLYSLTATLRQVFQP